MPNVTKSGQPSRTVHHWFGQLVAFGLTTSFVVVAGITAVGVSSPASAANTVTVLPGTGLQAAVSAASPGDTILLEVGAYEVSAALSINKSITIRGVGDPDAGSVIQVKPGVRSSVVSVGSPASVTIDGVTITGGNPKGNGGGIVVASGASLGVRNSTVRDNSAVEGAGIENLGTLLLDSSTIWRNTASKKGGGVRSQGTATIVNSTFVGNVASQGGALSSPGSATVSYSTIVRNTSTSSSSAGVDRNGGSLSVFYSIIGDNARNNGSAASDCSGTPDLIGLNLVSDSSGCNPVGPIIVKPASQLGVGSVANNGGPTFTTELLTGSPALDAVGLTSGACASGTVLTSNGVQPVTVDQRGTSRPGGTPGCDLGAYEFAELDLAMQLTVDTSKYQPAHPAGEVEVGVTSVVVDDIAQALSTPAPVDGEGSGIESSGVRNIGVRNISVRNIGVRNIGVRNIGVRNIGVRNIGVRNIGVRNIGVRNIALQNLGIDTFITSIPLSEIPLLASNDTSGNAFVPDGWSAYLAGTQYDGIPLQSLTLETLNAAPPDPMPTPSLDAITLEDLDLTNSVLGTIALRSAALADIDLGLIPLDGYQVGTWCEVFSDLCGTPGSPLTAGQINGLDLLSVQLAGGDVDAVDMGEIALPAFVSSLNAAGVRNIGVRNIGVRNINLQNTGVRNIGVRNIGVRNIELLNRIIDCSYSAFCDSGPENTLTLGDASLAGAIRDTATVGDILDIDPTLFDGLSLADFLAMFAPTNQAPWEQIDLEAAQLQNFGTPPQPSFDYVAAITVDGSAADPLEFTLHLPYGFVLANRPDEPLVVPTFNGGGFNKVTLTPQRAADGGILFSIPDVGAGSYELRVPVRAGIVTGRYDANAVLQADGPNGLVSKADSTSVTVVPASITGDGGSHGGSAVAALDFGDLQLAHIASGDDVDLYSFTLDDPALDGSTARVLLSNIPPGVDYDLSIYAPSVPSLRNPPETALKSLADVRYDLDPTDDVFSTDIVDDVDLDVLQSFGIAAGSYVARDVSSRRSNSDEEVALPAVQTGQTYYVAVTSYLAEFSNAPYAIRLRTDGASELPACRADDRFVGSPSPSNISTELPGSGTNTLYITNVDWLAADFGRALTEDILDAALGTGDVDGVEPAIVDVSSDATVKAAYAEWAKAENRCDPEVRNDVVRAIGDMLDGLPTAAVENVVILGGDGIVPMAAVPDLTGYSNEATYARDVLTDGASNELAGALGSGYLLSDDPYGTDAGVEVTGTGHELYVPDVNLGRLVESGAQILQQLDHFTQYDGLLDPGTLPVTAAVTGYDFLADGASTVADRLGDAGATLIDPIDRSLISETWTKDDYLALFADGGPDIVSPNAHYDHEALLPASADGAVHYSDDELVFTSDFTGTNAPRLPNRSLLFTMGCHAGLSVSDVQLGFTAPDWAEVYANGDNQWLAHTTFGYGDDEIVAYSERLAALFASNVSAHLAGGSDAPVSLGEAMMLAKQEYLATTFTLTPYDEKILQSFTYYGLPMYSVGGATSTGASAPSSAAPAAAIEAGPVTFGTTSSGQPGSATTPVSIDLTRTSGLTGPSNLNRVTTAQGDYFEVGGNTITASYRPIQPLVNASIPGGGSTGGFLVTRMTSFDEKDFAPAYLQPTIDLAANERRVVPLDGSFPAALQRVTTDGAGEQRLLVAAGQFQDGTDGAGVGRQRLFTSIDGQLYSAGPNSDDVGPRFIRVDGNIGDETNVVFFEIETDASAKRVVVLYQVDDGGAWRPLELFRGQPTRNVWQGGIPVASADTKIEFFVQAVDADGDVSISDNKVDNFFSTTPAEDGQLEITPTGTLVGGYYADPVTVTITNATDPSALIEYSVDGGTFVPYGGAFAVTGAGGHVIFSRDSTGARQFLYLVIDGSKPIITAERSPDPVGGWAADDVNVLLNATDEGQSGVATITYSTAGAQVKGATTVPGSAATVPITAAGVTTVTATATDVAGNVSDPVTIIVQIDRTKPVITAQRTPDAGAGWASGAVTVTLSTDDFGQSGVASITYSATGAQTIVSTTASGSSVPVTIDAGGITTLVARATDLVGNVSDPVTVTVRIDGTAPTVAVASSPAPDASGYVKPPVTVTVTATDAQSGVAYIEYKVGSGPFGPYVGPITVTAAGDTVVTARAVDLAGNISSPSSVTVRIDATPPTATLAVRRVDTSGDSVPGGLGEPSFADFSCADAGSGVKSCVLFVNGVQRAAATGAGGWAGTFQLDTSVVGTQTIKVVATDNAGNSAETTQTNTVSYGVCLLYDAELAKNSGANYTIKLQLCDAQGRNLSSRDITLTALTIDGTIVPGPNFSGNSNSGFQFRWTQSDRAYTYNLDTTGLGSGPHYLNFTTATPPVAGQATNSAKFTIK